MILFNRWEIREVKKRKTAIQRLDTRGAKREFDELRERAIQALKRETGK